LSLSSLLLDLAVMILIHDSNIEISPSFNYNLKTRCLVFRMLSNTTHEVFTDRVVDEVRCQLWKIREVHSIPDVVCRASGAIQFDTNRKGKHGSKRCPDSSFAIENGMYPCIVIETSYSQQKKDLPRLAHQYFTRSGGNIKVFVGLDIEYRGSRGATVSVWKSEVRPKHNGTLRLYMKKTIDNNVRPLDFDMHTVVLLSG
jgi:hypothetical protein